jgi:lysophospholipase L1-like esterase
MKNAQAPGVYRAWAHDYRADLPRFIAEVYGLPATADQLSRVEEALRLRERLRERLFADGTHPPSAARPVSV